MMYRWSPDDIENLKKALNLYMSQNPSLSLKNLNEDLVSILAVMESTNQDFVYIVGRDPNKV